MSIMNYLDWQAPANDNRRVCEQCGIVMDGPISKRYCGKACSSKAKRIRDKDAGKHHNDGAPEHVCEHCGEIFRRRKDKNNAVRFCSRECGFAAKSNLRPEQNISPDLREEANKFIVAVRIARCICLQCGNRFDGVNLGERYCSEECSADYQRARYIADNDNGRDRSPRPCATCGTEFAPQYGDRRRRFCSLECSAKSDDAKASRKASKMRRRCAAVEVVDPIKVFDRDSWRCQLCGTKTPRKLRGTYDDRAPELDHIIPISCGGEHSYRNTQCACRKCNAAKSATPMGQLRLFG
ncbi:HNH endonuclease [Brucella anthropi]|nr:HNH endonuclease [Brucella anthropi]